MVESWHHVGRLQDVANIFIPEHLSVAKHPEADAHCAKWSCAKDLNIGVC
jgi:hypothetical protein